MSGREGKGPQGPSDGERDLPTGPAPADRTTPEGGPDGGGAPAGPDGGDHTREDGDDRTGLDGDDRTEPDGAGLTEPDGRAAPGSGLTGPDGRAATGGGLSDSEPGRDEVAGSGDAVGADVDPAEPDGSGDGEEEVGLADIIPLRPDPADVDPADGDVAGGGVAGGDAEVIPLKPEQEAAVARGKAKRKIWILVGGAAASALALSAVGYVVLKPYLHPEDFAGAGSGAVTVRIAAGASAGDVGVALADAGVVASARSFVNITKDRSKAGNLHPGHYRLRKGMAAGAALDLLLAPGSRVVKRVTVPEGMRTTEALPRIAKESGLSLRSLQQVDESALGLPDYAKGIEGFLFPATYEVEPGATAEMLLGSMVSRFKEMATEIELAERAAQVHLTPLEALTVASIVQAEGGGDDDYPKIARVIYNRLKGGTPLQLDTTVLYAQGRRTLKVSERDTKVGSPYNTYTHKGLPPGPIANPGEKALMAALHPAEGDWYWFVTTDPEHRITKFTDKESEFVRYREELNEYLGTH